MGITAPEGKKVATVHQDVDEDEDLVGDMLTFDRSSSPELPSSPAASGAGPSDTSTGALSASPQVSGNINKLRDAVGAMQQLHRITVRVDDASFKHIHSIVSSPLPPAHPPLRTPTACAAQRQQHFGII